MINSFKILIIKFLPKMAKIYRMWTLLIYKMLIIKFSTKMWKT